MSLDQSNPSGKEATVLLSGGIDSASCAHLLKHQGFVVRGIFIDYGQAARQQERLSVDRLKLILDIDVHHLKACSLEGFGAGELIGRNAFLISSAIFLGGVHHGILALGIHSGTPYYDCSAGFVERMKQATEEQTSGCLTVSAPFLSWDKAMVYQYFVRNGLPIEATYSCEAGTLPPCGLCASCRDRRKLDAS